MMVPEQEYSCGAVLSPPPPPQADSNAKTEITSNLILLIIFMQIFLLS
jgi:hypothetical protein